MQVSRRKLAIHKARELLLVDPLFLDTETTGLGSDAEIIEIVVLNKQGDLVFSSLVKPSRKIPEDAFRIHGIGDSMVQNAPAWINVWPALIEVLANKYIGIYNADFDLRMIRQTNSRYGLACDGRVNHFCIMKLYAEYYHYGAGKYQKLEDAGRQCGISLPNSHRAQDDTLLSLAVFKHIAETNF